MTSSMRFIRTVQAWFFTLCVGFGVVEAGTIKVLKRGLGEGAISVTGTPSPSVDCGNRCDGTYTDGTSLTFTASFDAAEFEFEGWEGAFTSAAATVTRTMSGDVAVSARFRMRRTIPKITDFTPEGTIPGVIGGIKRYLMDNTHVNTPARFLAALPDDYQHNWMLMLRSESLQSGTAKYPRLLLPGKDARFVFTIGLTRHGSYPGSHPLAVEYMQWDGEKKNFRFHEIVLGGIEDMGPYVPSTYPVRSRTIVVDDRKCSKCHSTRNVENTSTSVGTNGLPPGSVQVKNKPNWEPYDSWGGMLGYNRDRIYQGSLEDRAFRSLFNLWNWRNSGLHDSIRQVIEQLNLQPDWVMNQVPTSPHRIARNMHATADDQHIVMGYDGLPPLVAPSSLYPPTSATTTYAFGESLVGTGSVLQGGRYVTLRHTHPRIPASNDNYNDPDSDEGRAVRFFDALGGLVSLDVDGVAGPDGNFNAQRIADELVNHSHATGSVPIDVRAIALAIARRLLTISGTQVASTDETARPLRIDRTFFDGRNGMAVDSLERETTIRTKSIPHRKLFNQKFSLDRGEDTYVRWRLPGTPAPANGLFQEYLAGTTPTQDQLRQEAFFRPRETFRASTEINGNVFVDREDYTPNTRLVTLFRYFLEPLGVSVDKWSLGVRGRSRAYGFADVFSSGYLPVFERVILASFATLPLLHRVTGDTLLRNGTPTDAQVIAAVNGSLEGIGSIPAMPKYTDIQRIFNKACIECHGGLEYPPYANYTNNMPGYLDLSEDETAGAERLLRAYDRAIGISSDDLTTSNSLYTRITRPNESATRIDPGFPDQRLMPFGGPRLSQTDIETIKRWILGPPQRPRTYGDPHLRTVSGVEYDFQAAGEYTLLRGDFFEVQARHTPVRTQGPCGPNPHTGLTTCVSVNSAVALRVGSDRITYQSHDIGSRERNNLELKVNGKTVTLRPEGLVVSAQTRIMPTPAPGGIHIESSGGTSVIITPGFWDYYGVWYLNIDIAFARADQGLMGAIAPGNWLPALPDGTQLGAKPTDAASAYKTMYGVFGPAWQVRDSTSLFDYAPGTSTATYALPSWPGGEMPQACDPGAASGLPAPPPIGKEAAEKLCADIVDGSLRRHCVEDIVATGEAGFAKTYRYTDVMARNKKPAAPGLLGPADFAGELALPVEFKWNPASDPDGDPVQYAIYVWPVHEGPSHQDAIAVPTGEKPASRANLCVLIVLVVGLLIGLFLYFVLRLRHPKWYLILALLVLVSAALAYVLCHRPRVHAGPLSHSIAELQTGRDYFWRVVARDGKGGSVQSETRRFSLK